MPMKDRCVILFEFEVFSMKDFVARILSQNNSELAIGLFDVWHFLYLFVIFGTPILISILMKNRSDESKRRVTRIFAYLTIGLYVADFFLMPLSDSYNGISAYKLPFNICTFLAVLTPFVEFNERFKGIKSAVVSLAITSSLMWMCYPGSALGGQPPFSYVIFQTFVYHGLLFNWGVLNLSLGRVKLAWRNTWKEVCLFGVIFLWAMLGNEIYPYDMNWLFIETSIFPFLKDEWMPLAVTFSVLGSCFIVYCAYFLVCSISKRHSLRKNEKGKITTV